MLRTLITLAILFSHSSFAEKNKKEMKETLSEKSLGKITISPAIITPVPKSFRPNTNINNMGTIPMGGTNPNNNTTPNVNPLAPGTGNTVAP
ncbi:MAG: hypothetical protein ACOYL6_06020 [Bacteriovoracaceae bacterium]